MDPMVAARVYLAETRHDSADKRLFDITVEGVLAFDDVDVFARSGGADRGMVLWRQVTSDGTVTIEVGQGAAGEPSIAGIELVSTSAQAPPDIDVSPTSIDFAYTYEIRSVVVTNTAPVGSAALVLQAPFLSGFGAAGFVVQGSAATLAPGESVTYLVGLGDTAGIPVQAQLVVQSDDPDEPVVNVHLSS
jgi:hypothetical protein